MKKNMISISISLLICLLFVGGSFGVSVFKAQTVSNGTFDLLIIAPEQFESSLQPFLDHKESVGVKTVLVTLEEIQVHDETEMGRDDAEKVKYYIYYALQEYGISFVLLVGGKIGQSEKWYHPVRYVAMDNGWEQHYLSDLYFADVFNADGSFSSWDDDNDGIFGEWLEGAVAEDRFINLFPDVSLGRIPCRSQDQLDEYLDKVMFYEMNSYQKPWFNSMLALAGDTYPESSNPLWVGYEGEYYADLALGHMSDFEPIRMYLSEGGFSGPEDVINVFNNGCGFVYFVGHGNPRSWGNHPPDSHEFVDGMQNQHMNQLSNKDKYPVCVISGCHNCQFDVGLLDILHGLLEQGFGYFAVPGGKFWRSEWAPESWGWKMIRSRDGGSIVSYGTSALGHTKEDKTSFTGGINELEVELFHQYGQLDIDHAGDVLKNAISWYLHTYPIDWSVTDETELRDTWVDVQVVQSYVLFGDPSLKIGGYQ